MTATPAGPPRLPFVLGVGITGHRQDALPPDALPRIREQLFSVLTRVTETANELLATEGSAFARDSTRFYMVSPLADGADQVAAEIGLDLGFRLHAILPFDRAAYRASLVDQAAKQRFDSLLEKAECVLELPGQSDRQFDAYVMTGRATVAHSDVLIAIWDGLPPRGRGGTAEVVELAIARGTPVIHVPVDAEQPVRLLWSAFDPVVLTQRDDPKSERALDPAQLRNMLRALLIPPPDPQERKFLSIFAGERLRRYRTRIEYPLLLAAAGVARFEARLIREADCAAAIEGEWRRYRENCCGPHDITASLDRLEQAYSWSDRLATHFAQTYRSGHIFNFILGGVAVCLGLSAFMYPSGKFEFALVEFVITLAIIVNTRIGIRNEWHRRWLDYRQLAERLRPMRSLKLLGLAAPDAPGSAVNPVPRRWIDWYSSGVWRAIGCPAGPITNAGASSLAVAIADHEVGPQVTYHHKNAEQIARLDRRLERIATLLFGATLIVCVVVVVGLAFAPEWIGALDNWVTLISAGFPALGTAVFGIRFQGDFGGSAKRSQNTADALEEIDRELRKDVSLSRAADLTEQAARRMLSDLDEWRLINQRLDLSAG